MLENTVGCAGLICVTAALCRVSFKAVCVLCLLLAYGHGGKYLTFPSAFILPVQTFLLSSGSRAGFHTVAVFHIMRACAVK